MSTDWLKGLRTKEFSVTVNWGPTPEEIAYEQARERLEAAADSGEPMPMSIHLNSSIYDFVVTVTRDGDGGYSFRPVQPSVKRPI